MWDLFSFQERCEAGLCPGAVVLHLLRIRGGRFHSHQKRRQPVQPCTPLRLVRRVLMGEILFTNDDALTSNTEVSLKALIDCFADAFKEFSLTISIKKTNFLDQDAISAPCFSIGSPTVAPPSQAVSSRIRSWSQE